MFKLSKLNLKHDDGHIKKDVERCTGKNEVLCISQKNRTVINAKYVPNTTPIENISFNFQLSGRGDGFTRSLDIVIIVPMPFKNCYISFRRQSVVISVQVSYTFLEQASVKDRYHCSVDAIVTINISQQRATKCTVIQCHLLVSFLKVRNDYSYMVQRAAFGRYIL
jgi:hypothetical protein